MLKNLFKKNSLVTKYQGLISEIQTFENKLKILTDSELRAQSLKLKKHIVESSIIPEVMGSDHCPVSIKIEI